MGESEPPRDILAAEEFAFPAPDPSLHHGPLQLPDDPTGIAEPHDVLAAEEFALPAPIPGRAPGGHSAERHRGLRIVAGMGAGLLIAVGLLRRFFDIT